MAPAVGGTLAVSLLQRSMLAVRVGLFQAARPSERAPLAMGKGEWEVSAEHEGLGTAK
jgi:hypothetical protein